MIIVITGPTCSSKSKIAIEVAKIFNGEIVNADAFQVYKELNIGTAKPSETDLKKVVHHLYSYKEPDDEFSIYDYQKDVRKTINELLKNNKVVVLVGGSGLYIKAALYDYAFKDNETKIDQSNFDDLSNEELHKKLEKIDKTSADKIHVNNRRRIIRALEIYYQNGKTKTEIESEQEHKLIYEDVHIYSTNPDKDLMYEKINNRVIDMVKDGLVNEALELKKKYGANLKSLKAIGYKEIIENENLSENDIIELIQKNTRHYAKRQLTFIRYQYGKDFKWINSSKNIVNDLVKDEMNTRTEALIGEEKLNIISKSSIAIFGIGGVGGTSAEALVRSGLQNIHLIDYDNVNASNLNRQILFSNDDLNKSKVDAAKNHLIKINPNANVYCYKEFFNEENINLFPFDKFDYVIDAIDSIASKISLIKYLLKNNIPFVSSLGMGNRVDPTKIILTTLDKTHDDPLARKLRSELRKDNIDIKKINVVLSTEVPLKDKDIITSMIFVPSCAGLLLAKTALFSLIEKNK